MSALRVCVCVCRVRPEPRTRWNQSYAQAIVTRQLKMFALLCSPFFDMQFGAVTADAIIVIVYFPTPASLPPPLPSCSIRCSIATAYDDCSLRQSQMPFKIFIKPLMLSDSPWWLCPVLAFLCFPIQISRLSVWHLFGRAINGERAQRNTIRWLPILARSRICVVNGNGRRNPTSTKCDGKWAILMASAKS